MSPHVHTFSKGLEITFLALQGFNVAFLLLHDWIPLGRLNNLAAMHREDTTTRRVFVTLLPVVPAAIGLFYSAWYFGRRYPDWLETFLWITLLLGILRAWWIPYLALPDPKRAERYKTIFADTHTFLPVRNGIVPDTLHVPFQLAVAATVVALFLRNRV